MAKPLRVSRRSFLKAAARAGAASALGFTGGRFARAAKQARKRPNVLFIAIDDLRTELGCYGVPDAQSPHIDALARSGLTFDRAYCQQAVCNPSRASLLTGLRPDSAKVWDLVTHFRDTVPDVVTLPQYFKQHGYHAVGMGKIFHNTFPDPRSWSEPKPSPRGCHLYSKATRKRQAERRKKFLAQGKTQAWINGYRRGPATEAVDMPEEETYDGALGRLAIETLERVAGRDEPFFLAVGFIRPHLPFVAPRKYWDLYNRDQLSLAADPHLPEGCPPMAMNTMYELRCYEDFLNSPPPGKGLLTEVQARRLKHGYYACVSFIDALVGRLLAALARLGLADDTVVCLWGDHGWKLGELGSWCKQTNYEWDTRVPLIVRAPGAGVRGVHSNALVEFVDLYPTLAELCGLPLPDHLEGTSLAPLLAKPDRRWKSAAFSQFRRRHGGEEYMGFAMRTDRYRYVEWRNRKTGHVAARELYDHQADAGETRNLAGDSAHADRVARLGEQLRAGWKAARPPHARTEAHAP